MTQHLSEKERKAVEELVAVESTLGLEEANRKRLLRWVQLESKLFGGLPEVGSAAGPSTPMLSLTEADARDVKVDVGGEAVNIGTLALKGLKNAPAVVDASSSLTPIETDWAAALVRLQARHRVVVRDVLNPAATPRLSFFTEDGRTEVKFISLLPDLENVRLVQDLEARPQMGPKQDDKWILLDQSKPAELKKLTLPDSSATMLDLFELGRGRLRIGTGYMKLSEITKPVGAAAFPKVPTPTELTQLTEASGRLAELGKVLRASLGADIQADPILQHLGRWQHGKLMPCGAIEAGLLPVRSRPLCAATPPADPKGVWPGFADIATNPVGEIETALNDYVGAAQRWSKFRPALQAALRTVRVHKAYSTAHTIRIRATRSSFFSTFLMPSTGVRLVPIDGEALVIPSVGVNLFFWPNPVDAPMWSGYWLDEFRRSFAIELALGTESTNIGPQQRYSGVADGDFPPLFVGLGLHVIPYTTLSAGVAFLERRRSSLVEEQPTLFVSQYFSASLQLNLPDIITAVAGRGTSSKAE